MSQYLTLQEVTQLLGVSTRTVRRYASKGLLTKMKERGRCIFYAREVSALHASMSKKGALGVIYDRVGALNNRVIALDVRVRVLEIALSSRQPDATLSADDVRAVKAELKRISRQKVPTYLNYPQLIPSILK